MGQRPPKFPSPHPLTHAKNHGRAKVKSRSYTSTKNIHARLCKWLRTARDAVQEPISHLMMVKRRGKPGVWMLGEGTAQVAEAAAPKPIHIIPYTARGRCHPRLALPGLRAPGRGHGPSTPAPEETPPRFSPSLSSSADSRSPRGSSLPPAAQLRGRQPRKSRAELMQRGGKANLELAEPKSLHFHFLAF